MVIPFFGIWTLDAWMRNKCSVDNWHETRRVMAFQALPVAHGWLKWLVFRHPQYNITINFYDSSGRNRGAIGTEEEECPDQ